MVGMSKDCMSSAISERPQIGLTVKNASTSLGVELVLREDDVELQKRLGLDATNLSPFRAICVDPNLVMVAMQECEDVLAVEHLDDSVVELIVCKKEVDHWCFM